MRRDALSRFLREVLVLSPLVVVGCGDSTPLCSYPEQNLTGPAYVDAIPDAGYCDPYSFCLAIEGLAPCGRPLADSCTLTVADGGVVAHCHVPARQVSCPTAMSCTGRSTEGVIEGCGRDGTTALGAYLARAATLESAAVLAFRRLGEELRAHGAPARLLRAAGVAMADEVRHAEVMTRLARARGAAPAAVELTPSAPRDLEAIATENAIEGCVRESVGAGVGLFQSRRAADPEVRQAFVSIAAEERAHAALAWAIASWIEPLLDEPARHRVAAARTGAAVALERHPGPEACLPLRAIAGLPSRREERLILAAARETLWPDEA